LALFDFPRVPSSHKKELLIEAIKQDSV